MASWLAGLRDRWTDGSTEDGERNADMDAGYRVGCRGMQWMLDGLMAENKIMQTKSVATAITTTNNEKMITTILMFIILATGDKESESGVVRKRNLT